MKHYIAIVVPKQEGEWRAYFPDFPGCRALGSTISQAVDNSKLEILRQLDETGDRQLPTPRSLNDIQSDRDWATKRGIDWKDAIISLAAIDFPQVGK